jgi:hypothetical protein
MTTLTIRGAEIPIGHHHIAGIPAVRFTIGDLYFQTDEPNTKCQFNTTNKAFCAECVLRGYSEAVASLLRSRIEKGQP